MYNINKIREQLIENITFEIKETKHGIPYSVFSNVPDELKISNEAIGKEVWVAAETTVGENPIPSTVNILKSIFQPNENKKYPDGGVVVSSKGMDYSNSYFLDEVVLHPNEIHLTSEQKDYNDRVRKAKRKKYINPKTGKKCSYRYSLKNGFITEDGRSTTNHKTQLFIKN